MSTGVAMSISEGSILVLLLPGVLVLYSNHQPDLIHSRGRGIVTGLSMSIYLYLRSVDALLVPLVKQSRGREGGWPRCMSAYMRIDGQPNCACKLCTYGLPLAKCKLMLNCNIDRPRGCNIFIGSRQVSSKTFNRHHQQPMTTNSWMAMGPKGFLMGVWIQSVQPPGPTGHTSTGNCIQPIWCFHLAILLQLSLGAHPRVPTWSDAPSGLRQ
jgi:hypothetical protein